MLHVANCLFPRERSFHFLNLQTCGIRLNTEVEDLCLSCRLSVMSDRDMISIIQQMEWTNGPDILHNKCARSRYFGHGYYSPLWLRDKCPHFDEIFVTSYTRSCHFDNFRCCQWWKFFKMTTFLPSFWWNFVSGCTRSCYLTISSDGNFIKMMTFTLEWPAPQIPVLTHKYSKKLHILHIFFRILHCQWVNYRADSRFAPSQWETSLQSNVVSHWLGTNLESALNHITLPLCQWNNPEEFE